MRVIVAAKIEFASDGVIETLGAASAAYFGNTSGLLNRTWFPILDPAVEVGVDVSLPWEQGSPTQEIGDIVLFNGGDAQHKRVLDLLITAQVAGLNTEVRRGTEDQDFEDMELIFVAKTSGKRFDGEELILPQRSRLDILDQPIATKVFDETTPNPRIVNSTVPLLIGPSFGIEPLVWDAPNQIGYVAENLSNIRQVRTGGAETGNWVPVDFGLQMTAGVNLTITVDAIGPPPDEGSVTTTLDETFDVWTAGEPDGWTVFQDSPDATITETAGAADIAVSGSPALVTDWVSLTNPELTSSNGARDFSASSGVFDDIKDSITIDDGTFAEGTTQREAVLSIRGFRPNIPADDRITGVEVEMVAESSNAQWHTARINRTIGPMIKDFDPQPDVPSGTFAKQTLVVGGPVDLDTSENITGSDVENCSVLFKIRPLIPSAPPIVRIYQVRVKFHYTPDVKNVRLYSDVSGFTAGQQHEVIINVSDGEIAAKWGQVSSAGDPILPPGDPNAITNAILTPGEFRLPMVPDNNGVLGIQFGRIQTSGAATIDRVRVTRTLDGIDTYVPLVQYVAGLIGLTEEQIGTASLTAHQSATGNARLGWYVRANESMAELMDLFARSLAGVWWPDRDGVLRSMLWTLDPNATPDVRIENIEVDGQPRRIRVQGNATLQSDLAERVTERAVGARNWRPLRVSETAGITEEFTLQERANVIEDWRVRRRANFDSLNPWTGVAPAPPPDPLAITSIDPTTGDEAGGTAFTITGEYTAP